MFKCITRFLAVAAIDLLILLSGWQVYQHAGGSAVSSVPNVNVTTTSVCLSTGDYERCRIGQTV